MRSAVEQEIPLLGICLGAQMLAKALGGLVYPHTVREIGWSEIELLPAAQEDMLFTEPTAAAKRYSSGTATPSICRPGVCATACLGHSSAATKRYRGDQSAMACNSTPK